MEVMGAATLKVKTLPREFVFSKGSGIRLTDPNPNMTPAEVMGFYASTYPEMTNGSITGPEVKATKIVYTISTQVGKKG